jgi:hypothetical protein
VKVAFPVADAALEPRVQAVAIVASALLFGLVIELVRRRRLVERYALLWMIVSTVILVLAIWTGLLKAAGRLVGIVPANFLFFAALGFSFFLMLHFSVATSRLSEQVKALAMEVARLDLQLRTIRGARANGEAPSNGDPAAARGDAPAATESRSGTGPNAG